MAPPSSSCNTFSCFWFLLLQLTETKRTGSTRRPCEASLLSLKGFCCDWNLEEAKQEWSDVNDRCFLFFSPVLVPSVAQQRFLYYTTNLHYSGKSEHWHHRFEYVKFVQTGDLFIICCLSGAFYPLAETWSSLDKNWFVPCHLCET